MSPLSLPLPWVWHSLVLPGAPENHGRSASLVWGWRACAAIEVALLGWLWWIGLLEQSFLAMAGGNPPVLITGLLLTFLFLSYFCKTTAKAYCCDPECFHLDVGDSKSDSGRARAHIASAWASRVVAGDKPLKSITAFQGNGHQGSGLLLLFKVLYSPLHTVRDW